MAILRALAASLLGRVRVRTPSAKLASMAARSTPWGRVKDREKAP